VRKPLALILAGDDRFRLLWQPPGKLSNAPSEIVFHAALDRTTD
jgi:hypothetical protein